MQWARDARRVAGSLGVALAVQAVIFQGLVLSGTLYQDPIDTYTPPIQDGFLTVYENYGLFGPYFELQLFSIALPLAAILLWIGYIVLSLLRARYAPLADRIPASVVTRDVGGDD